MNLVNHLIMTLVCLFFFRGGRGRRGDSTFNISSARNRPSQARVISVMYNASCCSLGPVLDHCARCCHNPRVFSMYSFFFIIPLTQKKKSVRCFCCSICYCSCYHHSFYFWGTAVTASEDRAGCSSCYPHSPRRTHNFRR